MSHVEPEHSGPLREAVQWCEVHAPTNDEPIKCCPCCEAVHERERRKPLVEALEKTLPLLDSLKTHEADIVRSESADALAIADDPTPLKTYEQLHLEIEGARSGEDGTPQTSEQLVDYIIKLYGDEFLKANIEIGRLRDLVRQSDKITVEIVGILPRVRDCLKRWAARYAASPHAKKNLAESRLLMQEVTELYEKLPHHGKD
jgi:hypothetical protein